MNIEEAIKVIKNMKFDLYSGLSCNECIFDNDTKCIKENGEDCQEIAIETLLIAYEKQQKEIEELKEDNKKKSIVIIEYQDLYEKLEDKIKAKIEEWQKEKEFYNKDEDREWGQFNNWDWTDTIINEMQSLLEKE